MNTTHNDPQIDPVRAELRALAQRAERYQLDKGWTRDKLAREFADLGSAKTFNAILAGEYSAGDLESWVLRYRTVASTMDNLEKSAPDEEPINHDLTPCMRLRVAFLEIMREQDNTRLIWMQGPSGSGKTKARQSLEMKYPVRVTFTEADETWTDHEMLGRILGALGFKPKEPDKNVQFEMPVSTTQRMRKLVEHLNKKRLCIGIDEAHHLTPRMLNLVKTLVNQTPGEFIVSAQNTLMQRLEVSKGYFEAQQLTHNRMHERIDLSVIEQGDVELMFKDRIAFGKGVLEKAVAAIEPFALSHGYFKFVNRVCRRVAHDHGDEAIDLRQFVNILVREAVKIKPLAISLRKGATLDDIAREITAKSEATR
ncbi:MAG: ATP-binding protein [Verrucomicrobia bacterium]|nr:ATP-binding protein [Verrucomicrobiota bacterium]